MSTYQTDFRKKNTYKGKKLVTFGCIAVGILVALVVILLLLPTPKDAPQTALPQQAPTAPTVAETIPPATEAVHTIPDGVTVAGIAVGGMTKEAAVEAVTASLEDLYCQKDMVITVGEETLTLSPAQSGAHLDIEGAVEAAMSGEASVITPKLSLDLDSIQTELRKFYDRLGGIYTPSGYWLEGEAPDVDTKTGTCQTLVINQGSAGHLVDFQDSIDKIKTAYHNQEFTVTLDNLGEEKEPSPLKLTKILEQVSVPAQNPRVDPQTLEVIPGKDGYGFDIEKASQLLENTAPGNAVRITMEYMAPAVSEEDAWFQDVLGYCKTEYSDNENRTKNLELACAKLDGIILQPGDTISYNETLGKRTREAGYLPAPAYSGTELVDEVGGGICQVSSTLYLSSLFAELTIVDRRNHGFPVNYIPLGLDATVNWGTTDLKIRNDYELPVKISAKVEDGYVKIKILGVEQRDYTVKMEYRVDDHPSYAAAFRCRYDKETGEQIYRKLDHTSTYLEDVWCWPGFAESATDEPTDE